MCAFINGLTRNVVRSKVARLESLSEIFNDDIADQAGNTCNGEIRECEDIVEGECKRFSPAVGVRKFTHQEVGVEKKNYEADFHDGAENRSQFLRFIWARGHLVHYNKKAVARLTTDAE
jgi:hypothetical protein